MVESSVLPAFMVAVLFLLLVPGPDMLFIVAIGASKGRRVALWAAGGIALAMFTHGVLAALGVAALIATSSLAFDVIRYVGALYLLFLAVKVFRAKPSLAQPNVSQSTSALMAFSRGFLTNLLNPKAILFCSVFLPQFVVVGHASIFSQMLGLAIVLGLLGLMFQCALAFASGGVGRWLISSARRQRWMERLMGVVFVGLALRLFVLEYKR